MGRNYGQRPATSVLAWRPRNPFITYEKEFLSRAQVHEFDRKSLHAKIMDDCIQQRNQKYVPELLLPTGELAWAPKKPRSHSADLRQNDDVK